MSKESPTYVLSNSIKINSKNSSRSLQYSSSVQYRFDSPQVKRNLVSTISNFENDLPNKIPRANYVRTSQRAPRAHTHTYPAPIFHTRLRTHAPARALMSSRANMPCELPCPCTNVPCAPRCSRTITSHKKHKFSMTCLNQTFGSFLSFSCEIKLHMKSARQAGMSLHSF